MSSLETLRQKPHVTERKNIHVKINEDINIDGNEKKMDFVDKRDTGFDINTLLKRMSENKVSKVFLKPVLELEKKPIIEKLIEIKKKIKAVPKKQNLIIEEGDEGDEDVIPL